MTTEPAQGDREKIVSKLPQALRQELKIRTAQLNVGIQDAVGEGIGTWQKLAASPTAVDTAGAESFSTWLPAGQWGEFQKTCKARDVSYTQGLAQSVRTWLDTHPSPGAVRPAIVRRVVVCNQKGGVGKTSVSAGLAEALAEDPGALHAYRLTAVAPGAPKQELLEGAGPGLRVLLVDFDPQTHLTKQLGGQALPLDSDSLSKHMAGEGRAARGSRGAHREPPVRGPAAPAARVPGRVPPGRAVVRHPCAGGRAGARVAAAGK